MLRFSETVRWFLETLLWFSEKCDLVLRDRALEFIVDLLIFPKIVVKNIANMLSQNIIQTIVGQCFCQNIATLRKVNIAHP